MYWKQLEKIIQNRNLRILFQPIYDLASGAPIGYESLTRGPENSVLESPEVLFSEAERHACLEQLEVIAREMALANFAAFELKGKLFINHSPSTFKHSSAALESTLAILAELGIEPQRVVIEVTESQKVGSVNELKQSLSAYKKSGFIIALDDLGAGYSGLKLWSELQPDIVKIDRYFIRDCHCDGIKFEFLKSIVELAKSTGTLVIAEGIEQLEELQLLTKIGVTLTQGFLLARPVYKPLGTSLPPAYSGVQSGLVAPAQPVLRPSKLISG